MARSQGDGTFKSDTGHVTDSMASAQLFEKAAAASSSAMAGGMGDIAMLGGKAMIILPIVGAIAMIFLMAVTGIRGFIIIAKTLPLFMVSGIIGLCAGAFVFIKLRIKIILRLLVFCLVSIIATAPFVFVSYKIYCRTNLHFPTMYFADYIQALPDGTTPKIYQKRFGKGKVLGDLTVNERITVNGITMDYKEYNITTASGITGWIPVAALPKDNAEMAAITLGLDGFEGSEIAADRLVQQLMEKYMDAKTLAEDLKGNPIDFRYEISENTLNRSVSVNVQTPLLHLTTKEYKDGEALKDSGEKVTFANILYADDCTIVYLTVSSQNSSSKIKSPAGARGNTNAWATGLVATDLNTGEKWQVLQADYRRKTHTVIYNDDSQTETVVFFFPPFKSRNFSLTHEVLPMPDRDSVKTGYGGLLGFIANQGAGGDGFSNEPIHYNDWNFPEVQVK